MRFVVYSSYLMPKQTSQPLQQLQLFMYSMCVVLPQLAATRDYFQSTVAILVANVIVKITNAFLQCIYKIIHCQLFLSYVQFQCGKTSCLLALQRALPGTSLSRPTKSDILLDYSAVVCSIAFGHLRDQQKPLQGMDPTIIGVHKMAPLQCDTFMYYIGTILCTRVYIGPHNNWST